MKRTEGSRRDDTGAGGGANPGGGTGAQDGAGAKARTERKLERLLAAASDLIARQGYGQTSIRDVARETGFSLAGMYYYFENKEDLLYQIQHRSFASLVEEQERVAGEEGSPEEKLRRLVDKHLSHFADHFSEMKVCTFEMHSLQGEHYATIEDLRRRYFKCIAKVVGEIMGRSADEVETDGRVRRNTLFVFGMLNWIFTWYDPQRDGGVAELGDEMISLLLGGLPAGGSGRGAE